MSRPFSSQACDETDSVRHLKHFRAGGGRNGISSQRLGQVESPADEEQSHHKKGASKRFGQVCARLRLLLYPKIWIFELSA